MTTSIPLVLDLAAAWRSRDDRLIAESLRPILADRHTTTDALLTLVAVMEVK